MTLDTGLAKIKAALNEHLVTERTIILDNTAIKTMAGELAQDAR